MSAFPDYLGLLKQNWYILLAMAVVVVVSIVFNLNRLKKSRSSNTIFLRQHPDAAKVYLTSKALITAEAVAVATVNGAEPQRFFEGGKSGFYVLPGQCRLQLSYTYTRPGIMYKNVTKSTGVVEKDLLTEANKSYILGFDREEEVFTFTEI